MNLVTIAFDAMVALYPLNAFLKEWGADLYQPVLRIPAAIALMLLSNGVSHF